MKTKRTKNIQAFLAGIAVTLLIIFFLVNGLVLIEKYHEFSTNMDSSFGAELVNQAARSYQNQFSRATSILQRVCSNPELLEYKGSSANLQRSTWLRNTLYHYGTDATIIDSVYLFSSYQSDSYGRLRCTAQFDDLVKTDAVRRALNSDNSIILTPSDGAEKEQIDILLGESATKYYILQCFRANPVGTIILIASLKDDCFSTTLSPYLVVEAYDNLEYSRQLSNEKVELLYEIYEDEAGFQNKVSAKFADGVFQVYYLHELLEDDLSIQVFPLASIILLLVAGATILLLRLCQSHLTEPIKRLKKAADQYDDVVEKEHRAWVKLHKRKRNLREAVIWILLVAILPPILLFNVGVNYYVRKEATQIENRYRSQQCDEVFDSITALLDDRMSMMVGIAYDNRIQSALRSDDLLSIDSVMRDYGFLYVVNDELYLYNTEYDLLSYTDTMMKSALSSAELTEISNNLDKEQWCLTQNMASSNGSIRVLHWIKDINTGKILGVLQCEISMLELQNCWAETSADYVTIQDSRGNLAYTSEINYGDLQENLSYSIEKSWKQPYSINRLNISVGTTVDNGRLFFSEITGMQLLMFLLLLLVTLLSAQGVANKLIDQLIRIETASNNMYNGFSPGENTLKKFPENLIITELSELGESFNQMADRIELLMDQIVVSTSRDVQLRAEKKQADALAMQLQINPHFLYNTLESISSVISVDRKADAEEMVSILGNLFRYSADQKKTIVSLDEDLEMLDKYIRLMNIRLNGTVRYSCDISSEIRKTPIIKLLLQPIIENVFMHGGVNHNCQIHLSALKDNNDLILCVQDNGKGIDPGRLLDINRDLQLGLNRNRIGLSNVNSRLKIIYGEEYGVSLESEQGEFTRVYLRVPFHQKEM